MKRYHKNVFLPPTFDSDIEELHKILNKKKWHFGFHSIRKFLHEQGELSRRILRVIYKYKIKKEDVFEVYYLDEKIVKFCVRISLTEDYDLILVIDNEKTIVTMYTNNKEDTHQLLDETKYNKE